MENPAGLHAEDVPSHVEIAVGKVRESGDKAMASRPQLSVCWLFYRR